MEQYLIGFTDAEGCFSIALKKQKTARFGWVLDPVFHVTQHKNNKAILDVFKEMLQCGRVIQKSKQNDVMLFIVDNRRELKEKILPFFEGRLIVKKKDFEIFSEVINGLEEGKHADIEEFKELVKKVFHMNLEGKQRRYDIKYVLNNLRDPQRLYAKHESEDIVRPL